MPQHAKRFSRLRWHGFAPLKDGGRSLARSSQARFCPSHPEILDKGHARAATLLKIRHTQDKGRMKRKQNARAIRRVNHRAPLRHDGWLSSQYRQARRRAQCEDQPGPNKSALLIQPPAAGLDLARVGRLVQASLAARLMLEVLDRIGQVNP